MRLFGREFQGFQQLLVVLVMVLLIASGLCGMQWALMIRSRDGMNALADVFMITGILELCAMAASLIGIVVVLIAWLISALRSRFK